MHDNYVVSMDVKVLS